MKRILGLAALLGHALGAATGIQVYGGARGGRGERPSYAPNAYYSRPCPLAARWWHDDKDPAQILTIQAAEAKQARKAEKLKDLFNRSWANNYAHHNAFRTLDALHGFVEPLNLNPFYLAK